MWTRGSSSETSGFNEDAAEQTGDELLKGEVLLSPSLLSFTCTQLPSLKYNFNRSEAHEDSQNSRTNRGKRTFARDCSFTATPGAS